MTEDIIFSIIIPAYNEEKYLPLCLDSINSLNYPKDRFEVIVVDNGSTDRTREIARSYGTKTLIDKTLNVSGLRNYGASQATGKILAFLDADCMVMKDWMLNASIYFETMDVVIWGGPPVPPKDAPWVQKIWFSIVSNQKKIEEVNWIGTVCLFVRRNQFEESGGFDKFLISCEDVDFCYRMSQFGRIISDTRIGIVHLRDAATVKEFFHKELWRGKSNWSGLMRHGFSFKELPSLSIPLYFGLFLPVFFIASLLLFSPIWLLIWIFLYLFPSGAVLFKTRKKPAGVLDMFRLLFLVQVYFFSRTIAVFKSGEK